ncbi:MULTISPECIES: hypothetical protein [unclassified Bradyrhizobium]|uniref:hypothetical protein n=1 Tax=unclassified Bradyrhizobium TaxID=2631580 RepID=UPI00211ED6BE|nr:MULTISPECIES: hypothetical protein [unclassified Bradyrhizobium]MDD1535229.1 hypothetical protein [Bradyrhizobium sp. WBOS8]MDD1584897.1 hypothetical protein [Bradyrhizobium sp. WBOS4]UUO50321.1 hypothetical protein DCM78_27445 [Bradyrhizobium sp. WBOS04]UUO59087.1 hypothetical protein DCM80_07725 [Bradyrhizobium sp. WBOS08]
MLDVRLVTTSLAMLIALMSVALAEPKDQVRPAAEARPIRVILPAPWEPATTQAEAPPVK